MVSLTYAPPGSTCSLCGREFTGRGEHGAATHYNCRNAIKHSLDCLASNLRVAAGLEWAFVLGRAVQMAEDIDWHTDQWRPGCGKESP